VKKKATAKLRPVEEAGRGRGRPPDPLEKRRKDELEATFLYLEYRACREFVKGRTSQLGHRDALKIVALRHGLDPETVRRRIRKVAGGRKVWDWSSVPRAEYLLTKK
jgi:hypothetical protein